MRAFVHFGLIPNRAYPPASWLQQQNAPCMNSYVQTKGKVPGSTRNRPLPLCRSGRLTEEEIGGTIYYIVLAIRPLRPWGNGAADERPWMLSHKMRILKGLDNEARRRNVSLARPLLLAMLYPMNIESGY